MSETDKYYIARCLDGHPDDFRHLVSRYKGPLLAHLTGKLRNTSDAEEAAQETFVRAYFGLAKLKKPESCFSWLLGISTRIAKELQRANSRRRQEKFVQQLSDNITKPELSHDFALEKAIALLPDNYKEIVLLRYYGDCSCKNVAEQLNIPIGTVTKTLSRAHRKLRQLLQQSDNSNNEVRK
jgi:RNA polymerase sigma-70 factor (ECF subfamily)